MSKRAYPFLDYKPGVDWKDVNPKILSDLNALGRALGKMITITSGYRSVKEQWYLWNHASELGLVHYKTVAYPGKSEHQYGQAVDATIRSTPLGTAVSPQTLAKYNLKCSVPNDRVHTDLVGGSKYTTTGANDVGTQKTDQNQGSTNKATATNKSTVVPLTATLPQSNFVSPAQPTLPYETVAGMGTLGSESDVSYVQPRQLYETWQSLASQANSSPDTQLYAQRLGG